VLSGSDDESTSVSDSDKFDVDTESEALHVDLATIKCLTVQEPYATALVYGTKNVENRRSVVSALHRKLPAWLGIHAGKKYAGNAKWVRSQSGHSIQQERPTKLIGWVRVLRILSGVDAVAEGYEWARQEATHCYITDRSLGFTGNLELKGRQTGSFQLEEDEKKLVRTWQQANCPPTPSRKRLCVRPGWDSTIGS